MFIIIGYVVVLAAVFGGYAFAGGSVGVLLKAAPHEMITIGGAAVGAFLVGNDIKVIRATVRSLPLLLKGSKYTKERYMDLLALLYDLLQKARKEGLMAIEGDVETPQDSALFAAHEAVSKDAHLVEFMTDYLRIMVSGKLNPHEIESLMDSEIETHHQEANAPAVAIQRVGDALPAFGIVAAVLGVVQTMASVGVAPAVLGQMIASALVGTFLGILLSYGFVGPLAQLMEQKIEETTKELVCVKTTLVAIMQGYAPVVAVEFGRKVLFSTERPSFIELERHVKNKRA